MSETIDSLQIEINAKASKANDAIDRLVDKLDRLTTSLSRVNGTNLNGLANGVQRLGNAMQVMNTIKTADFTRLATNLTKLGTVNVSALNSAASSMSHLTRAFNSFGTVSANAQAVGEMAKNIAKLGNKSVQTAITNIPQLATAMNNLMTTLSRSPQVSRNIIDMTNALANLTNQGSKVGSASNSIVRGLNRTTTATKKASSGFRGLASYIGRFYATYFMAIRGLKGLWKSVESTADYIEAYNYFNVSLGKIGADWSHQFEKYGYDNAESYADSFNTRLSESLGKLSGVRISVGADGQGLLTESGMKNLGLNIQEITQYASQLASVTNSVGQTGEISLAISSSFTKLAGDISSLFNVDYSAVARNLQSGLIGQSRALYKYGIDITNATLQTYAYNLGLSKAVSEMTQAEKMQLRMLAILDQSKVSWGDLANTINSPSNMIRQFANNLKETGLVLGQLFIPLMKNILPAVNGATIAIKRLMVSIAELMGVKIDLDAFGQGYTEIEEDIDGVSDALDDVNNSAKKATGSLSKLDELSVINMPSTTSQTGAGGSIDLTQEILEATSEYEKAWNEAYAQMENRANEFANKIEKALRPITEPFKNLLGNIQEGDWFGAGYNVNQIATALLETINSAIDKVDWENVGENIGEFLAGLDWLDILTKALRTSFKIWGAIATVIRESFEEAPISTAFITAFGLLNYTPLGSFVGRKLSNAIKTSLSTALASFGGIGGLLTADIATVLGAGTLAEIGLMIGTAIIGGITAAIGGWSLGQYLYEKLSGEEIDMSWTEQFAYIFKAPSDDFDSFINGLVTTLTDFENSPILTALADILAGPFVTGAALIYDNKEQISESIEDIKGKFNDLKSKLGEKWDELERWFNEDISPWFTKEKWSRMLSGIPKAFNDKFKEASNNATEMLNKIISGLESMVNNALEGVRKLAETVNKIPGINIDVNSIRVSLPRIPKYEDGGYPKSASLFWAGERGVPELMGTVGGRTAVAGGAEITGIKDEIRSAANEEIELLKQQNSLLQAILNKEFGISTNDIGRAARSYARDYSIRNGRPAYDF